MSDQPTNSNGGTPPQNEPGDAPRFNQLPIGVLAQYVKDLSFENPNAPQSLMPGQQPPQVSVNVDVQAGKVADNMFEVVLNLRVEANAAAAEGSTETVVVFLAELAYAGLFTLQGLPPEHHRAVLLIEGPRLLFPFARAIIAEATREGGYPPLLINPIDFSDLYRQLLGREAAQQGGTA